MKEEIKKEICGICPVVAEYLSELEERIEKLEGKEEKSQNDKCIFCGEPINKNIQPWNYYFPSQIFHLGCQEKSNIKQVNFSQERVVIN